MKQQFLKLALAHNMEPETALALYERIRNPKGFLAVIGGCK